MNRDYSINAPKIDARAVTQSLIVWDEAQNVTPEMFAKYEARMTGPIIMKGSPTPCEFAPGNPTDTEVCDPCHGTGWGVFGSGEPCHECDGFGATFIYGDDFK